MMKIIQKMADKTKDHMHHEGVTIAFLGDSVTQGCFEVFKKQDGHSETIFDKRHSYERYVFDILSVLFPMVTVNMINAGISGDQATHGAERVGSHVIRHQPDLTVVCYGLNECRNDERSVEIYVNALQEIFEKLKNCGSEIIFLTPNMMNTKVSDHTTEEKFIGIAKNTAALQNNGTFEAHIEAARALCKENRIPVCDCYAIWKRLYESGVDTTELLANKINHPTREMNQLFAYELVRTMFEVE